MRQVSLFDWTNLGVRAASAAVLAPLALLTAWSGGWLFLLVLSVGAALLAVEWGVMSAPRAPVRVAGAVTAGVLAALFVSHYGRFDLAWIVAAAGAGAAALVARGVAERPRDAAFGVLYIGVPCIALMWLRGGDAGLTWTVMLFVVTWSADVAAFLVGTVLKGPKLWPRFSPNKTWSGFCGGLAGAVAASMAVAAMSDAGISAAYAVAIGLLGGVATMAGDLWESMLKRRFGVKDSGALIPGHGGLLDRVDGLLFAALAVAGARLAQPWFAS